MSRHNGTRLCGQHAQNRARCMALVSFFVYEEIKIKIGVVATWPWAGTLTDAIGCEFWQKSSPLCGPSLL